MKLLIIVALIAAAMLAIGSTADANPETPPGQGECNHGNSDKPCREDPQPDHGKDCEEHGPHEGGVNEDHCNGDEDETLAPTPTATPATPVVAAATGAPRPTAVASSISSTPIVAGAVAQPQGLPDTGGRP